MSCGRFWHERAGLTDIDGVEDEALAVNDVVVSEVTDSVITKMSMSDVRVQWGGVRTK